MATNYEHTKMYLTNAVETIIAYPTRVTIQMIRVYFPSAGDAITLTDGISGSAGEAADDVIAVITAGEDTVTETINWSARPRRFFGLKVSAISDAQVLAYIYVA